MKKKRKERVAILMKMCTPDVSKTGEVRIISISILGCWNGGEVFS